MWAVKLSYEAAKHQNCRAYVLNMLTNEQNEEILGASIFVWTSCWGFDLNLVSAHVLSLVFSCVSRCSLFRSLVCLLLPSSCTVFPVSLFLSLWIWFMNMDHPPLLSTCVLTSAMDFNYDFWISPYKPCTDIINMNPASYYDMLQNTSFLKSVLAEHCFLLFGLQWDVLLFWFESSKFRWKMRV